MADWRKQRDGRRSGLEYRPPPGYRESGQPLFAPGAVIANTYQVRDLVASTRTGQMFEARDMMLERIVALKGAWRDGDVTPLLTEARAIARIHDPCVAEIHGAGVHHEISYVVAERIEGQALQGYVAAAYEHGAGLSMPEAVELLALLARGMAALHRVGLWVPRVSSRNLVITPERRLVMAELAFDQGRVDTEPLCLAPEVIDGVRAQDDMARMAEAIDLYGLGCVAVEVLIGEPPFKNDTLKGLQQAHVYAPPPKLVAAREDIPQELADLVDQLLAKRPQHRPASAAEVARQLRVIGTRLSMQRTARVLLADRDPGRRQRLASALRRAHAALQVDTARDGDAAVERIQAAPPDVLIFDMDLEGSMNGLELCMYVHGLDSTRDTVLVALGNDVKPGDAAVLEHIGVPHVLSRGEGLQDALVAIALDHVSAPAGAPAAARPG